MGSAAAPFTLDLVGGGKFELSKHLGKDVVVLDFFATWCRPCVIAMPAVERAVKRFEPQGVVLVGVDLAEPAEKVAAFLTEHSLALRVALDPAGGVAAQYGVMGVPHTVVIGRDGQIAHVHVGYRADLEAVLAGELAALTAPPAGGGAPGQR